MVIRNLTTLFSIIIIISLGIFESISVNNLVNNLFSTVVYIQENIDENKNNIVPLYEKISNEQKTWEKNEPYLTLIFNHKDLSNICDSLSRLSSLIKINNYDDAIVELNVLYNNVKDLSNMMFCNIHNIL